MASPALDQINAALGEVNDPEIKRPITERSWIFSETPAMPGMSAQTPRTMRSILTPADEASYSARMISGSSSAFILAMMRAFLPARARSASLWMALSRRACSVKGDCHKCRSLLALPRPVSWANTSLTSSQISGCAVSRPKSV